MNRRVSGPRKAYVKTFLEWLDKHGAKVDGVEIAECGDQGKRKRNTMNVKAGNAY
jgi:hypothetical protein